MQTLCSNPGIAPATRLPGMQARTGRVSQPLHMPRRMLSARTGLVVRAESPGGPEPPPSGGGGRGGGGPGFGGGPLQPASIRRSEDLVSRVAALGFAFSLAGELLTGLGPMSQLQYETGLPWGLIYLVVAGFVAHGAWSLRKGSRDYTRASLTDLMRRERINPLKSPRRFLVRNEVLIGRTAMLAFLGACLLEYVWGGEAPLAHLGLIPTGVPLSEGPWWVLGLIGLFLLDGLGVFGALATEQEEEGL